MENTDSDTRVANSDEPDVFSFKPATYGGSRLVGFTLSDREDLFYNMNHKKRGLAVIFNHHSFDVSKLNPRSGTEVDAENLKNTLTKLGFEVIVHKDLRKKMVQEEIRRAAEYNHQDCDCFLMAVFSHGEMGILYAKDQPYKADELWLPFRADKCPSLAGKPKLFFIQACQGDMLDPGITLVKTETDGHVSYKIPVFADFLIAYSTVPGYYSWRNTTRGSWFIQALCMELENHADKLDLLSLLTLVQRRVAMDFESNTNDPDMHQKRQVPCFTSMLTRLIRFHPKKYQMELM